MNLDLTGIAHDALEVVEDGYDPTIKCVVDSDIEKFFDSLDHKWLIRGLSQRIIDPVCYD